MPLKSRVSPDIFLHIPPSLSDTSSEHLRQSSRGQPNGGTRNEGINSSTSHHDIDNSDAENDTAAEPARSEQAEPTVVNVVFMITGNPGLISYYHPFLAKVVQMAEEDDVRKGGARFASRPVVVAGFSLGGFEVEHYRPHEGQRGVSPREGDESRQPGDSDGDDDGFRDLLFPPSWVARNEDNNTSMNTKSNHSHNTGGASRSGNARHNTAANTRLQLPSPPTPRIYSLQEQVHLCFARLDYLVARLRRHIRPETSVKTKVKVTLMGHSVGAYIALEMVRLWHERERRQHGSETDNGSTTGYIDLSTSASNTTPRPRPHSIPNPTRTCTTRPYPEWSIPSAILLTPTIQDLHLSSSGRIATPLLTYLPFLPLFAQSIVSNVLTALLPRACLVRLVQSATGTQPGSHGLEATMAFLESRSGVRQALEMAACELREIRAERWGEEVWGASHHDRVDRLDQRRSSEGDAGGGNRSTTTVTSPRLFFWFAKQDHWVADVTREEILRERGRGRGGLVERTDHLGEVTGRIAAETPTAHFRIDETDGLVHAWCLTQSELVAKRVGPWLRVGFDEEERGGGRGTAQRETC